MDGPARGVFASDLHVHPGHFRRLLELARAERAAAVLVGGDILAFSGAPSLEGERAYLTGELLPAAADFRAADPDPAGPPRLFLDLGNDDALASRPLLAARDGELWRLIHGRGHELVPGRLGLLGYMCVPPTPFRIKDWEKFDYPGEPLPAGSRLDGFVTRTGSRSPHVLDPQRDGTIAQDLAGLEPLLAGPFVLVTHSPPAGTALDLLRDGRHVGSRAIRAFIERWAARGLVAAFHGHIHEAPDVSGRWRDELAGVPCVNVGASPRELRAAVFDLDDIPGTLRRVVV